MDLAEFLAARVNETSLRAVERETNVSYSVIDRIVKRQLLGYPELETLIKISLAYKIPLLRILEMAGITVTYSLRPTEQVDRIATLVREQPELYQVLDRLSTDPDLTDEVLSYIEIRRQRAARRSGEPDPTEQTKKS